MSERRPSRFTEIFSPPSSRSTSPFREDDMTSGDASSATRNFEIGRSPRRPYYISNPLLNVSLSATLAEMEAIEVAKRTSVASRPHSTIGTSAKKHGIISLSEGHFSPASVRERSPTRPSADCARIPSLSHSTSTVSTPATPTSVVFQHNNEEMPQRARMPLRTISGNSKDSRSDITAREETGAEAYRSSSQAKKLGQAQNGDSIYVDVPEDIDPIPEYIPKMAEWQRQGLFPTSPLEVSRAAPSAINQHKRNFSSRSNADVEVVGEAAGEAAKIRIRTKVRRMFSLRRPGRGGEKDE